MLILVRIESPGTAAVRRRAGRPGLRPLRGRPHPDSCSKGSVSMSIHGDRAYAAFLEGCNCAQSVAVAFAPELGLTRDQVLRLASGFGAGFGRMREVCGAFSGITLVLGALYGNTDPAGKTATYARVQELAARYQANNGGNSLVCRELLGLQKAEGSPVASPRTAEYYKKRPCPQLVRLAADLLDAYITENPPPEHKEDPHAAV